MIAAQLWPKNSVIHQGKKKTKKMYPNLQEPTVMLLSFLSDVV